MNPLAPVVAVFLPAAIVAAEHYAPWRRWLRWLPFQDRSGNGLPRLLAYGVGTLTILLPATIAALAAASTAAEAVMLLWLAAASAGVGTACCWWYDWHNRTELQRQREADAAELFSDAE